MNKLRLQNKLNKFYNPQFLTKSWNPLVETGNVFTEDTTDLFSIVPIRTQATLYYTPVAVARVFWYTSVFYNSDVVLIDDVTFNNHFDMKTQNRQS